MRYLVIGATGYIGGRLAPRLAADDAGPARVRCLVRDPGRLTDRGWAGAVEVVRGDLADPASVRRACADVDVVHLLAHPPSMGRREALILAQAAREAGVRRIVTLSGPFGGVDGTARADVAETLLRSGVPTVVLRTGMVVGSGSAGVEVLRDLAGRLPVALVPRYPARLRPVAVEDVLDELERAVSRPVGEIVDLVGPDSLTWAGLVRRYAAVAGTRQPRVLPVLSRRAAPFWFETITSVPRAIAGPLAGADSPDPHAISGPPTATGRTDRHGGTGSPVGAGSSDVVSATPTGVDEALALALADTAEGGIESHWSDAGVPGAPDEPLPPEATWAGTTVYRDDRTRDCAADVGSVWRVIEGIGGRHGWYSFPLGWWVRGWMDRAVGGVGLARGRRDPDRLRTGDALDWWRVETLLRPGEPRPGDGDDRGMPPGAGMLRLRAEMKVPGPAWLELSVTPRDSGSTYHQRALFLPDGLAGRLYWWAIAPFHGIVFGGMIRNVVRTAERDGAPVPGPARRARSWIRSRGRPSRAA